MKPIHAIKRCSLRFDEFVVPLVKAVQELRQQVEDQQAIIDRQKRQLGFYEQSFSEINGRLEALETNVEG